MHGNCKCFHHWYWCAKILVGLAWVAAVLFLWTGWRDVVVWGTDADGFFKAVVVFVLLAFSTKFCGCYRRAMMMHGNMSCPACEGKGGEHTHQH